MWNEDYNALYGVMMNGEDNSFLFAETRPNIFTLSTGYSDKCFHPESSGDHLWPHVRP